MKKQLILSFIFLLSINFYGQQEINTEFATKMNYLFGSLDKTKVPHGILLDYGMEFTNVPAYNGTLTDSTYTNSTRLGEIYKTLLSSRIRNVTNGFVVPSIYKNNIKTARTTGVIVLSGLYFKYAKFKDNALAQQKITYSNGKFYDKYSYKTKFKKPFIGIGIGGGVWQNPYEEKQTFAMTPFIQSYLGLNLQVKIPSTIFYSNYQNQIASIQIDFGNGNGYVTVPFNQNISVNYAVEGVKTWTYKLNLTNGTSMYNKSKIKINKGFNTVAYGTQNYKRTQNGINTYLNKKITASKAYNGNYSSVNLTIDLAHNHSQITNPLIVAEGFDVGVIFTPENQYGYTNYSQHFIPSLYSSGQLYGLLKGYNRQYDIIYVDWDNGVDYLQGNAYALEEVIKWVNNVKQGNEKNVVLGQSMGGVISRYALADMEEHGENHDTRLFISHDAPQQGANIPISLQYFYRHIHNNFFNTSLGVLVSIFSEAHDYMTLLDKPATKQLLKNRINTNYGLDNSEHILFYNELKGKGIAGNGIIDGYPKNCRNIAVSNGSECGNTQGFNTGDDLMRYNSSAKIPAFDFLLSPIYGLLGLFYDFDFLGVTVLSFLPGSAKFHLDFQSKAAVYSAGSQIYKGKFSYTKKLFWIISITTNITNVKKNQPVGVLPYDFYGGGYYDTSLITVSTPSGAYVRDKFSFIPTASALDIGKNNIVLNNSDYLQSYVGATPPTGVKSSPFANFSTDFDTNPNISNKPHISFNSRNGKWLAKELTNINIEYTDCSAFCSSSEITGADNFCTTSTYTIDYNVTPQWTITSGANLVAMSVNGNSITLTRNNNATGLVTLHAYVSKSGCGSKTLTKQIYVGTQVTTDELGGAIAIDGINDILVETTDGYGNRYEWRVNGVNVNDYGNDWVRIYFSNYPCYNNQIVLSMRKQGICGWSNWVSLPYTNCTGASFKFSSNPMKKGGVQNKITIIDKTNAKGVSKKRNYTISIYDKYGNKVYSKTQKQKDFIIGSIEKGFYIVKFQTRKGKIITKKLIIE